MIADRRPIFANSVFEARLVNEDGRMLCRFIKMHFPAGNQATKNINSHIQTVKLPAKSTRQISDIPRPNLIGCRCELRGAVSVENRGFVATQLYRLAAGAALPLVLCAGAPHDGLMSQMPQNFVIAPEIEVGLQRLVELYEQLTPACLSRLNICYAPHVPFKAPFNEVRGQDGIRQIFAHMFTIVDVPRFIVTEQLAQGQRAFLAWEFHFRMRRWRKSVPQCIRGGTFLRLNAQGLVLDHRNYWNS